MAHLVLSSERIHFKEKLAMKNALQLLKQDHKHIQALLEELCETTTRSVKTRPRSASRPAA